MVLLRTPHNPNIPGLRTAPFSVTMRLLNCSTLELEEFAKDPGPDYAILSHTWEEDEVLFKDFTQNRIECQVKKGWYKIGKACKQALRDELDYVWIDTLCIDKSSSAELTEAINSMFKWYRTSRICYAYLSDVPENNFADSRWFTRGWTLQELIAPEEVQFYDRNWSLRGLKSEMLEDLQNITGVDTTALQGSNLRFFSVARKMSWASKRETTREEDLAYCLLGIFDISMPLLYGEGQKAFIRLQEEILREYEDESLFAWECKTPGWVCGLLAPSPAAFEFSANIMPCLTQSSVQSGPIVITNRGIRLEVPVEPYPKSTRGFSDVYIIRLNCKPMAFDWVTPKQFTRVGIFASPVGRVGGYLSSDSTYTRVHPEKLHYFSPDPATTLQSVFLLKVNHLQTMCQIFDPVLDDAFWVRTMPTSQETGYYLASAGPLEAWHQKQAIFSRARHCQHDQPFFLIFRKTGMSKSFCEYFIIAFGGRPNGFDPGQGSLGLWCGAIYHRGSMTEDNGLNVDELTKSISRTERTVEVSSGGIILRCAVRSEVIAGHRIACVDLVAQTQVLSAA